MANAIQLAKLPDGTKMWLELNSIDQILKDKGLTDDGSVQAFHTNNVMRRMYRYMPRLTAATVKVMIAQTNIRKPYIILDLPYAKFLYHGKLMVDPKTGAAGFLTENGWRSRKGVNKVKSSRDITYTKTKHPLAGPYWDRRLSAAEGAAMARDLQNYINRRAAK